MESDKPRASKFERFAMLANEGATAEACCWPDDTTWQDEHQRSASERPFVASAAKHLKLPKNKNKIK